MSQKSYEELKGLMSVVARLLAYDLTKDIETQKDRILLLNRLGLSRGEIAKVLDTTTNNVSVTISEAKK